jgi:hypothetical protein
LVDFMLVNESKLDFLAKLLKLQGSLEDKELEATNVISRKWKDREVEKNSEKWVVEGRW